MAQLNDALHARIVALSELGDSLVNSGSPEEALSRYREALALLPKPIEQWEAAMWLLAAIGDTLVLARRYEEAAEALRQAMRCPDAIGNPFLHLRLGEAEYEIGDRTRALDDLARAYIGAGEEIFAQEDPKYLAALRGVLLPATN